MIIFLVGFMGCGKTTLGKKLSAKLNYTFVDLDKKIEQVSGERIADYFSNYGESSFRELERDTLQKSSFPADSVVATGGGAPCFFDNMEWMNKNGLTIYISLPPNALASRLENAKTERPLIKNLNHMELVEFIKNRLEARDPFYKKAQYVLNGTDITAEKVVESIRTQLK
ncbi:shikimate kinase [Rubrolithibacter danxiaensis]|uniref:shikimate kinase n=1 Tax=Rubrolithibacter danxiaensis TaxID=3390805 RepID=UPI003BF8A927